MRRAVLGLLMATSLAGPALAQWQGSPSANPHGRGEIRDDRREVAGDRRELQQDRHEIRQDRREIAGDYRRGDDREAWRDRRELNGDRHDFRGDRQDFRADRRDLRGDRQDYRDDHRGPPPGGPGRTYGDRGYAGRPGGGWNHSWRSDRRYDWQGWRAQHRDFYHRPGYYAPRGYGYRRFNVGIRIAPLFYAQRYWINDPYYYRLPPAYGPYRWVRYFDDVLLIDVRTGLVVDSINGFFW